MTNTNWVFIGDVNPIEHGGKWVRLEEGSQSIYEIIVVQEWLDNHIAVAHGTVDLEDTWFDVEAVERFADTSAKDNPHDFVASVISYYGINEIDSDPDFLEVDYSTEWRVTEFLKGHGITI